MGLAEAGINGRATRSLADCCFTVWPCAPSADQQLLATAYKMDLLGWFADVARDGERDCLAGRKRRDETERRASLGCLKCYDQTMAIGLRRVISNAGERTEVDFVSLDRL